MINDGWMEQMNRTVRDNRISGSADDTVKNRLKSRGGFTLAETLLAVLIMLLVSVVVATGMPAATNAYNKVVLGANAKVMLSTAITALHDEIGTAWRVEKIPGDTTKIAYFNASTGAKSELSLDAADHSAIQIKDYVSLGSSDLIHDDTKYKPGKAYHLLADTSSGMYVTYTSIAYDDSTGIVTIAGLKVCKKSDDSKLVEYVGENGAVKDFTIRVISKKAADSST